MDAADELRIREWIAPLDAVLVPVILEKPVDLLGRRLHRWPPRAVNCRHLHDGTRWCFEHRRR